MRQSFIFLGLLLFASTLFLQAQDNRLRIAIFDPVMSGSNFDEGTGIIIREMVSTAIVNSGKYLIIERSLIDRVLKEQNFSNSGAVDDSQISQIGKLAGANKVILSVLSSSGSRAVLSLKMIDVESANIEKQKVQVVELSQLFDIITPLSLDVIGEKATTSAVPTQEKSNETPATSQNQTDTDKSLLPEQTNRDTKKDFSAYSLPEPSGNDRIVLYFPGESSMRSNPAVKILVDDVQVGTGNLHKGFTVDYPDNHSGKYQVKIQWSGIVGSGTYSINTEIYKYFIFQYNKAGNYLELKEAI